MISSRHAVITLATLLVLAGCSEQMAQETTVAPIPVKGMVALATDQTVTKTFTGSLEGEQQARIFARLSEPVTEVKVDEGQPVTKGQVLLTLDRYGPTSNYDQTRSIFLNSQENFKKMKYLFDQGAISEHNFDAARTEYEVNKASFEAVEKLVDIQTPIAGTVTSVRVSPGAFVNVGQEIATVASTNRLRVKFDVSESDLSSFEIGHSVTISNEVTNASVVGKITAVARSAEPSTRSYQIEAVFDNPDKKFKAGMFVEIEAVQTELLQVMAVPREAVLLIDNQPALFVVNGSFARQRAVTLGTELSGQVVVVDGLQSGDTVVVLGQNYLSDSAAIKLTQVNGQ